MIRWLKQLRQRAHLQEVARVLEAENDRLRDENDRLNREVEKCHEILAVLVEATAKAEQIYKRSER